MLYKPDLIFISIASYRDTELLPTIKDLLSKARNPENLRIGICWQKDENETLDDFVEDPRFRIYECHWSESKGTCWSRHIIQKHLYQNEEYYFQLDSHHRFLPNWDQHLKELYVKANSHCQKPIITAYASVYEPSKDEDLANDPYLIAVNDTFEKDGDIVAKPLLMHNHASMFKSGIDLIPARFLSGHFIFTHGKFCKECPYDPNLYFRGEEITLSARAYTHGYDFFHPTYSIVWHYYVRKGAMRHFDDHDIDKPNHIKASIRDMRSKARQRQLFHIDHRNLDFRLYDFGNKRSMRDFEMYAGLDFFRQRVHKYAARIHNPTDYPYAYPMSEAEWNSGLLTTYSYNIHWNLNDIADNIDYDYWFFGFENQHNQLLWRKDFTKHDQYGRNIIGKQQNHHTVTFSTTDVPHKCVIIPHHAQGWGNRIDIFLTPEMKNNYAKNTEQ